MQYRAYVQYVHALCGAYRLYGISRADVLASIPPWRSLKALTPEAALQLLAPTVATRLGKISPELAAQVFSEPKIRVLTFEDISVIIPIINEQGREWYLESALANFDFTIERKLGLLDGAKTMYDFGGHHGVWAAYYAKVATAAGTVYSFEPSILNVEVSTMLFLLNGIHNVVNVPTAAGTMNSLGKGRADGAAGMLVDYVSDIPVIDVQSIAWHHAQFIKMDIEGFEYDLLTTYPWIFDLATHMHLELHIPHLERRGLDYRDVLRLLPFDQFVVHNSQYGELTRVMPGDELSGYCSLMMKRISGLGVEV